MAVRDKILNPLENLKTANRIASLRSERGYLETKYDASPVKHPKSLRRQIGQMYDGKKVRNRQSDSDPASLVHTVTY